jgi:starch synthase
MHIAFAASECVPYSKTGGLADVIGALPRWLANAGHRVSVYLPRYRQTHLERAETVLASVTIPFDDRYRFCSVLFGGNHSGVDFYFIEYPPYFDRDGIYGTPTDDYPDNAERFALFCRAVLEAAKIIGVPDVFHCHDWQTGLIPVLLRTQYASDPLMRRAATVLTIHNIGYQGLFPPDTLPLIGLPWDLLAISKLEFFGNVNFLKGGIVFADMITTVSRRYAHEIQTAEYGFGLDGVLRDRSSNLAGILNGADYESWNPATDPNIAARYSENDLSGKKQCRADLLQNFGITDPGQRTPILGIVSRFAGQKGFDLIAQIIDRLVREDLKLVVLGSGDKRFEDMFLLMQKHFPQKVGVKIVYDNRLAHKIEAGADMFLMPSRYEPCGLNQIYSLKYGTVPIVRATGGLDDTVDTWDDRSRSGTGFKFADYNGESLLLAIKHALQAFSNGSAWETIMRNGMKKDFSWDKSSREYIRVYERARQLRGIPMSPGA